MTDGFTISALLTALGQFGLPGLMIMFWYLSDQRYSRLIDEMRKNQQQHQKEIMEILARYEKDMIDQRNMYENNVLLVKDNMNLCGQLKDIVTLNTSQWQAARDDINKNQFCPRIRLEKRAEGALA